jgi:hypothetical protein
VTASRRRARAARCRVRAPLCVLVVGRGLFVEGLLAADEQRRQATHGGVGEAELVDEHVDERDVRRAHLGEQLLDGVVAQVDGELELDDDERGLDTRLLYLEATERRKEDLLLGSAHA